MFGALAAMVVVGCHWLLPHAPPAGSSLDAASERGRADLQRVGETRRDTSADGAPSDAGADGSIADLPIPGCPSSQRCAPAPTAGMSGLAYLRVTPWPATSATPPGTPPACSATGTASRRYAAPSAPACTTCGSCTGAGSCTPPRLRRYKDAGCTGSFDDLSVSSPGVCKPIAPGTDFSTWLEVSAGTPINADCKASGGKVTPAAPFGEIVDVCAAATGASCGSGKVCVGNEPAGSPWSLCYRMTGNQPCPSGTSPRPTFGAFSDGRSCSACCAPPLAGCAGGSYSVHVCTTSCAANTLCMVPALTVNTGECKGSSAYFTQKDDSSVVASPSTPTVVCNPENGAGVASGAVTSGDQVIFCCLP